MMGVMSVPEIPFGNDTPVSHVRPFEIIPLLTEFILLPEERRRGERSLVELFSPIWTASKVSGTGTVTPSLLSAQDSIQNSPPIKDSRSCILLNNRHSATPAV